MLRSAHAFGGGRRRAVVRRDRAGVSVAARRPRLPRPLTLVVVAALVAAGYVSLAAGGEEEPPTPATTAADVPERPDGRRVSRQPDPDATAVGTSPAVAEIGDVHLEHPAVHLAAFHEAGHPEALALEPVGTLLGNANPDEFQAGEDRPGTAYRVLASQGRPRAPTSAVDLVLEPGSVVVAPVDGEVAATREYAMPGGGRDWRVVIEPDDGPDLHVSLTHLEQPRVAAGDPVEAGVTAIASVRALPFERPVDAHLEQSYPHVHIEVKAAGTPEPPDPNEPAAPPES